MEEEKTQNQPVQSKSKKKKWLPFLIRGVMAMITAFTLVQQLIIPGSSASNFPIYLGFYFLANGILTFKMARSDDRGGVFAALASIIGGLMLIVWYPFGSYSNSLISTDMGRYAFSAVVIIIGLLQVQDAVQITLEPIMKRANAVFGFLEILLGIVVLATPVNWEANAVAFVWTATVSIYMLYVAGQMRRT
ncbi:MAG: hypothetical protein ACHQ03_06910 [Candidatus Bathyarchaeia archaeon]